MPNDPSRPHSWKGEDKSALPGGRKSGPGSQYTWKPGAAPGGPAVGRRKRNVVFLTIVGTACLLGLVALLYLLMAPRPTCITVVAGDFRPVLEDLGLPFNIYGDRGARDLLDWANSGDRARRKWCSVLGERNRPWPVGTGKTEDDWLTALASRKEERFIIYMAQPGGTDEQGNAILFDETGGQIRFADILKRLKDVKKKKLVVVDATQIPSDWRHGILFNDFATGLQKLAPDIESDPDLLVLCASGPGERSWTSDDLGRSVFTHFVLEGLTRAPASKGEAISAADLYAFLGGPDGAVNQWVQRNRADRERPFHQVPMLLPAGAETKDRATKFLLAYRDQAAPPLRTPVLKDEKLTQLKEAWLGCDQLATSVPAPWVYTPRLWHRYLELLLRYEHLLRAGEEAPADQLAAVIAKLKTRLNDDRRVDGGDTLSSSLSMPSALGRDAPVNETELDSLCRTTQLETLGTDLKNAAPPGTDMTVIRAHYFDHLLQILNENPKKLTETLGRIKRVDDGGKSRPEEVHLAVMLAAHKAPGWVRPADDLIRLALETRILADKAALSAGPSRETHPYTERLPRFLADEVTKADANRRRGEDLLFCAPSHHIESKRLLSEAKLQYEQVRKTLEVMRVAVEVRDRVFAKLPSLTDWVVIDRKTYEEFPELRDPEARVRQVESLWKESHLLADRLAQLDPLDESTADQRLYLGVPPNDPVGKPLDRLAQDVAKAFGELERLYLETATQLSRVNATGQTLLQDAENCLVVPGILKASDRINLLRRLRDNSAELAKNNQLPLGGKTVEEADTTRRYRGRLARAMLGTTIINALSAGDTALVASANLTDDDAPILAKQLGAHWQKLLNEVDRTTQADIAKSVVPLPWRERLGLLAGTRTHLATEVGLTARDARWHNTFDRLSRRAEVDHWYDENKMPYSEDLASRFLRPLRPSDEWKEKDRQLRDRRERGKLKIEPPPELVLTTETNVTPKFKIVRIDPAFDPGLATVAPALENQDLLQVTGPTEPHPINLTTDAEETVPLRPLKPFDSLNAPQRIKVNLSAYYRGQVAVGGEARLRIEPVPDLIVSRPPAKGGAQIAVRADDDLDLGAIAIVFDCSGSMVVRDSAGKITNDKKFRDAKEALREFQSRIPAGTLVTLWAYGFDDNGHYDRGEKLLTVNWNPNDRDTRNKLAETVEPLRAFGFTPLMDTMVDALNDKQFQSAPGFKTLVVLSDGMDEHSSQPLDGKNNARDKMYCTKIADRFRTEIVDAKANTSIQMMLFKLDQRDAEYANLQFPDEAFKALGRQSRKYSAENKEQLKEYLSQSVRPRVELTRNGQKVLDLLARRPDEALEWSPPKDRPIKEFGQYTVHVRDIEQNVMLEEGDQLALRLRKTDSGLRLVRQLMADEKRDRTPVRPLEGLGRESPFVLGQIDRLVSNGAKLNGNFTLEHREREGGSSNTKFDRPPFVWWELRPMGGKDMPSRSRVTTLYEQSAPTWTLNCDNWPQNAGSQARAAIEVWASPQSPDVAEHREIRPHETIYRQQADRNRVLLSASFEQFKVPMDVAGAGDAQECMVVRIESSSSRRYLVSLDENIKAEVHNYFFTANCSTSAFVIPEDAKNRPIGINLISIDDAKTSARTTRLGREPIE
ncbi:MAG: hypothetical protein ACJ8C4_11300 [Gemmataceae bacterium]